MPPRPLTSTGACTGKEFQIERGVGQGCPLAPYLFLLVGEVITHIIKKAVASGRLRGITLPGGTKQQSISQYADDSSFMVRGEKRDVDELVRLLKVFSEASGMEINWENHVHTGLINSHTNLSGWHAMAGNGRKKAICPNCWVPLLDLTLTPLMWTNFCTLRSLGN